MLCQKNLTQPSLQGSAVKLEVLRALRPHAETVCSAAGRNVGRPKGSKDRPTLEQSTARFWTLVEKLDGEQCWIWKGCVDRKGYGRFSFQGEHFLAHRFAWFITHGKWPAKPYLCHRCDNPSCVRPAHCFEGDAVDNNHDAIKKGRVRHWGRPHIMPEQVKNIRALYATGNYSYTSLAQELHLPRTQIFSALNKWKTLHLYECPVEG